MLASSPELQVLLKTLGFNAQHNENLKLFLSQLTYTQALNDALFKFLESLGYQGELNEKLKLWELANYPMFTGVTVTTPPYLNPALLIVGNQIQTAFVGGVYSYSSAVTETVFQYTINGVAQSPTYVLQSGDTVAAAEVRLTATGISPYQVIYAEPTAITDFNYSTSDFEFVVPAGTADTTSPVLSLPSATATSITLMDISVTTDETPGTLYYVVTASSTAPTGVQVKAGQDHTGAAGLNNGSYAVSTTGAQSYTGVTYATGTGRYIYFMHEDLAGNKSNVVSSGPFGLNNTITYLGETGNTGNGSATITVDLTPLSLQDGDYVLLDILTASNAARTCSPSTSGYTAITTKIDANGSSHDSASHQHYKFMTGTPDTSVVINTPGSSGTAHIARVRAYRNVNQTTPLDIAAVSTSGVNTVLANGGSVTPVTDNALIVVCGAGARINTTTDLYTSSDLANFTSDQHSVNTYNALWGIGHKLWHTGDGAFDVAVFANATGVSGNSWGCKVITLRPA